MLECLLTSSQCPLQSRPLPFDDPDWLFELKLDGYRTLVFVKHGRCRLISCNGHPFVLFSDLAKTIAAGIPNTELTVLDGEIVCLDRRENPTSKI
jgi:bifunctional non-homologous end joining protein LigD